MTTKTTDTVAIKSEIVGQERAYWQAVKDHDAAIMMRLTDDPCIIAGASGVRKVDQKMLGKIIESAQYTLHNFDIDEDAAELLPVGDEAFILAYNVKEDLTVDGKPVSIEAADTSVWRRHDDRWVCSLHTESILGDSYGRDRVKKT